MADSQQNSPLIYILLAIVLLALLGGGAYLLLKEPEANQGDTNTTNTSTSNDTNTQDVPDSTAPDQTDTETPDDGTNTGQPGTYAKYSPELVSQSEGNIVLFFRASWCPTCKVLNDNLNSMLDEIPSNLTILDVNYDKELDLRRKYEVPYQHTLVHVDQNGNEISQWSGGNDLDSILENI